MDNENRKIEIKKPHLEKRKSEENILIRRKTLPDNIGMNKKQSGFVAVKDIQL